MKIRFWLITSVLLLLVSFEADAQRWKLARYEAGVGLGTVHTFMDIGAPEYLIRSFQFIDSRVNVSSHVGFRLLEDLTVKLDLNYLMIGGVDPERRPRSLQFTSNCFEHVIRFDYTFIGGGRTFGSTALYNRKGMVNDIGSNYFYVFAGAGGILSKAIVRNQDGSEAIGNPSYYNNVNWGIVIPAGFGYKRSLASYFDLSAEIGGRFSFTDKIDGYQHATASLYNDKYLITSIQAVYRIRNNRKGVPIFKKYGRH